MITLSILSDFCNYWWFWWIMPFVLGCLLVHSIMKKWKTMYNHSIQSSRKQKKKIDKNESIIAQHLKEIKELKGQLAIQRGKIHELETELMKK